MAIKARLAAALVAGVLAVSGVAEPAAAASQPPTPTTNPVLGPIWKLITPPRRPAPPRPAPAPAPPPAPTAPAGSGSGKRIVYCVSCQRVWLVEADERVSKTHPVSGRAGVPRRGTYKVFSKSMNAIAGSRKATMTHMVRFARGRTLAIGFHAIPRDRRGRPIQSESELGSYRSLGCVRQADADAVALWNFAPIGTKVVVT
jgi:hypothetical protein